MGQIADGWEIVSRRTNRSMLDVMSLLLQFAFMVPEAARSRSTVTWTVRQTTTGSVHNVTARSEQEAGEKIALGMFDAE